MSLYHFTSAAHLPFILKSGALNPGRNKIGGFPDPDFLWATTQAAGDRTASVASAFRAGTTRLVRFTLKREHFRPWQDMVKDFPQWTASQIERLEYSARGLSNPADWFCRIEPLPLAEVVNIETRSWHGAWSPLESREVSLIEGFPGMLAVVIAGKVFASREIGGTNGVRGYALQTGLVENFGATLRDA